MRIEKMLHGQVADRFVLVGDEVARGAHVLVPLIKSFVVVSIPGAVAPGGAGG